MSLSRVVRVVVVAGLLAATGLVAAPLAARPADPQSYQVVATLPNVVDGQRLVTLVFDRTSRRLYGGSQFGLYWADLSQADPKMQGPAIRKNIRKVEVAPDLGRVFYAAVDEIGYIDEKGGTPVKIATGNAWDLVYEPTQHEIYASFARSAEVQVFDARTGKLTASVPVPGWNAFELESVPGKVFCFLGGKDGLYAIDAKTHQVAGWPVSGSFLTPGTLEADPGGKYLFMARNQEIDAVDLTTGKVIGKATMFGTASIGFDPGTGLLVATWTDVRDADHFKVVALRPDANGLTQIEDLKNPYTGLIGVEPTNHGFIQAGDHGFLVWSTEHPPATVK